MPKKTFIVPKNSDAVTVLMQRQRALFDVEKGLALARGVDLLAMRVSRYMTRWKEALAKCSKGVNVLDIGSGWLPEPIFNLLIDEWNLNYHAMDIDKNTIFELIVAMGAAGRPATNFCVGEISALPYEKKFELVFSSHCLEHSTDIVATLAEIRRVLIDGGALFMSVPLGFDLSDEHLLFLGPDEWAKLLSLLGFEVISSTIGSVYTDCSDLTIYARQYDSAPMDKDLAQRLVDKFSKSATIFLPHNNSAFCYPAETAITKTESIIRAQKSQCLLNVPGTPKALIVIRHAWSGCMRIRDDVKEFALDCYSPINFRHAINLDGFSNKIKIEVNGSNPLSMGSEGVLCGVLYDKPSKPRAAKAFQSVSVK